jgi:hypothetical protein
MLLEQLIVLLIALVVGAENKFYTFKNKNNLYKYIYLYKYKYKHNNKHIFI